MRVVRVVRVVRRAVPRQTNGSRRGGIQDTLQPRHVRHLSVLSCMRTSPLPSLASRRPCGHAAMPPWLVGVKTALLYLAARATSQELSTHIHLLR